MYGWARLYLPHQLLFIDLSDGHAGVNDGRSGQALIEGEDSRAFMPTAVFIYSLTGTSLLGSASEGRSHLFQLLRLEIRLRLESDTRDHTNTHMHSSKRLTFMSTMNEPDWKDGESWRKNEGWSQGLLGPREGRSFIDCLSKRILQLLVALLNKSGLWKERSHQQISTPEAPFHVNSPQQNQNIP